MIEQISEQVEMREDAIKRKYPKDFILVKTVNKDVYVPLFRGSSRMELHEEYNKLFENDMRELGISDEGLTESNIIKFKDELIGKNYYVYVSKFAGYTAGCPYMIMEGDSFSFSLGGMFYGE
jgi:hypothetical protein